MNRRSNALLFACLVAFMGPARADDARLPFSLTSFGASLSSRTLSLIGAPATYSVSDFSRNPLLLANAPRSSFAASVALSDNFALDSGYNTDIAQRFGSYDGLKSPLLPGASFLGLANGGLYVGATWLPAPTFDLRLGMIQKNNRLDRFSFDPVGESLGLPLAFDASQSRTFLAGANWEMSDWAGVGLAAIQNSQSGTPYGVNPLGNLDAASRIDTSAVDVAAHFKLGNGWVTTASYAEGLTQLDQRIAPAQDNRSYSIAIAKHGVFGDDAVGFSFSHPTPGVLENGFDMVAASGDMPPVFVASGRIPDQTPETDLQLGYVTTILNGVLDLQANASYQMNYQGQTGATSLSVLSRAKIKF